MKTYTTRLHDPNLSGYIESEHRSHLGLAEFAQEIQAEVENLPGNWVQSWQSPLLTGANGDTLLAGPPCVEIYAMPASEIDERDPVPDYGVTA